MPARGYFVTGTDTGVGKTHVAVQLTRALVRHGARVAVMKPVAAGALTTPGGLRNEDALALAAAANVRADYATINPYCLQAPISPHLAAGEAGVTIAIQPILERFARLAASADVVIVEGAGGWLTPIGAGTTMADVASALGVPVLLVVGLRLGCLNHAQLSARAIVASGLPLAGWIANHIDSHFERMTENLATLRALLGSEPLYIAPWTAEIGVAPLSSATVERLLGPRERA
jgi:dethiobiotin synthetase